MMLLFKALLCLTLSLHASSEGAKQQLHSNNWAVLVDTSRFWFNYRHISNVLSVYRTVKSLGIPDSQIILMLADDVACNPRNPFKGQVFNNAAKAIELYGDNIEVDYRGNEVTVESFLRVLSDRHPPGTPSSKRLQTDDESNILVFMTGHGGDEFLKFQDSEEISSQDIGDAFAQMHEKGRYNQIFFAIDTCQANTLFRHFYSPNIVSIGSSALGENSYSHHGDRQIGVAVIDRFTYFLLDFFESSAKGGKQEATVLELFESFTFESLRSTAGWETNLNRSLDSVPLTDFFGSMLQVDLSLNRCELDPKIWTSWWRENAEAQRSSLFDDSTGWPLEENEIF